MAIKRNLGIGLDVLLTANEAQPGFPPGQNILSQARLLYGQALEQDESGNTYEAYHLYRQVMDLVGSKALDSTELSRLVSRTCNNLAVLLFESGHTAEAAGYLRQAIAVYPQNRTAIENMKLIRE